MTNAEIQRIAEEIHPLIRGGKCVAWLGSGLSIVADYPGWPKLVKKLCRACKITPLKDLDELSSEHLARKADECKSANQAKYHKILGKYFGTPPTTTRSAYNLLMKLPFMGYVTTNYDPLLADSAAQNLNHYLYHYPDLPVTQLGSVNRPVYYMHGLAHIDGQPCGENLVLSHSEFEEAYNGTLGAFMESLVTYHSILFIGCRLSEQSIREALAQGNKNQTRILQARSQQKVPRKLMLLSPDPVFVRDGNGRKRINTERTEEAFLKETQQLEEFGIEVLRYDPTDKKHYEIEKIIQNLCSLEDIQVVPKTLFSLLEDTPSP